MKVQQSVVDYFEQNKLYDKNISSGSFLTRQHLDDPYTGFLSSGKAFAHTRWEIDRQTDYVLFDNIERDNRHNEVKKDTTFHLVKKIEADKIWTEIYKRNR